MGMGGRGKVSSITSKFSFESFRWTEQQVQKQCSRNSKQLGGAEVQKWVMSVTRQRETETRRPYMWGYSTWSLLKATGSYLKLRAESDMIRFAFRKLFGSSVENVLHEGVKDWGRSTSNWLTGSTYNRKTAAHLVGSQLLPLISLFLSQLKYTTLSSKF